MTFEVIDDSDGDGLPRDQEIAAGTDPADNEGVRGGSGWRRGFTGVPIKIVASFASVGGNQPSMHDLTVGPASCTKSREGFERSGTQKGKHHAEGSTG